MAIHDDYESRPGQMDDAVADRGMPSITKTRTASGGVGQKIMLGVVGILTVLALVAVNGGFGDEKDEEPESSSSSAAVLNRLGPAPSPLPPPPPPPFEAVQQPTIMRTSQLAPPPPPQPKVAASSKSKEPTPQERKMGSPVLAFGEISKPKTRSQNFQQVASVAGNSSELSEGDTADGLGAKLKSTTVQGTRAGLLKDRSYFITQGTFLNCALETAISSAVPGMTSCRITRDIYSTDKKQLLIERGSRIVGQYQGGLQRGQARIFVLWTRVETPHGVTVTLDSPGTDSLGRSGLDGFVDTHFWERFSGAIMLSLIDDVGTFAANQSAGNGPSGNQIQFGGTTEAAKSASGIALENSINIPPTLNKNQGDEINIFVARDLDFRGVYDLRVTE